jgi:hypothetical protein
MKTIMFTYPGFPSLPRGIKQLLVTSETHFFGEAGSNVVNTYAARLGNGRPGNAKIAQSPFVPALGGHWKTFAGI